MSWDVLLIKTETNDEQIQEISSSIPFDRNIFITNLKAKYPKVNCQDNTWLILNEETFSIEFNIGEKEPIDTIMLHIRGGEEPSDLISFLCSQFNCRAYDTSSDKFIQLGQETAFQKWKQFRDKVLDNY